MSDFAQRMTDILNHGALNLAMAIGYKNQIFDILEDMNKPVSVSELASASGLHPRYLKEWLGIMVTGRIIELFSEHKAEDRYLLPPEHASFLTRKAGNMNMGVYTQEIPLLTSCAMAPVSTAFQTGAGVPFSCYPDFQAFMAELSDAKHEKVLIDKFLPTVDNGQLLARLIAGIRVCDLGCGHGVAMNLMAGAFPRSTFIGIDNHEEAIRQAAAAAQEAGIGNVVYRVLDAASIHGTKEFCSLFDYICAFDAIHDQSHPLEVLKGVRHMLAPGGIFSMIEIKARSNQTDNMDHPMGPFLYTVSLMHCLPVGLNDQGSGLGMMWGREKAEALLREAG
ncbi:MAG: methyltransferase domain-containing protein, partial [Desulfocapsaceae bacterium]|nr:methyltransferase domain-containing protein [Desulfocapsaceae bacterium]